ncbi:MAG: hypothetical protein EGQ63_01110 [Clostridiales bacterium]|nr:hypothetical protein [Clostridiales bacterium]
MNYHLVKKGLVSNMQLETRIQKEIKFERIRNQFGCGYYAVCCHQSCPCRLKSCEYNPQIYRKLMSEFEMEERVV